MANGGDIIIKGGSVDIDYDDAVYPKEAGKPRNHKGNQTITRVTVVDASNNLKYDSDQEAAADPTRWTVSIFCTAATASTKK